VLRSLAASLRSGLSVVFWVIAAIACLAALTSLLFPEPAAPVSAIEPRV
jgi:hypothetical protein